MSRKSSRKDISADFEKLNITLVIESEAKLENLVSLFQSKILSAIKIVIDKKKRPDIESIYDLISRSQMLTKKL